MQFTRINPVTGEVASRAIAMQVEDSPGIAAKAGAVPLACGKAGIDSFTELRWITVETQPGHFPIW